MDKDNLEKIDLATFFRKKQGFLKELECLINKHSLENDSDTPDFILAEYINRCLTAFNEAVKYRECWYGRKKEDVGNGEKPKT